MECPVCGETKKLTSSLAPRNIAAGIMAAGTPTMKRKLTECAAVTECAAGLASFQSIRCCSGCKQLAATATDKAMENHGDIPELQPTSTRSRDPIEASLPLKTSGGASLVSAIMNPPPPHCASDAAARRHHCHRLPLPPPPAVATTAPPAAAATATATAAATPQHHLTNTTTTPPSVQKACFKNMASGTTMGNRDLVTRNAAVTSFQVGDKVEVSKDMQPGVHRIGGRAEVMAVEGNGASERFDVRYLIGGGGEKGLSVTALSAVSLDEGTHRNRKRQRKSGGGEGGGGGSGDGRDYEQRYYELLKRKAADEAERESEHAQELVNRDEHARVLRQQLAERDRAAAAAYHNAMTAKRSIDRLRSQLEQERNIWIAKHAQVGG